MAAGRIGRMARGALVAGLIGFPAVGALAVEPDEMLVDPALEARARAISKDLRCLVCRNESIDDSGADLARDLRLLVRERLTEGDSDAAVLDYIVARYGEFVLLRPRFSLANAVLWFGGPAFLLAGGLVAAAFIRRRAAPAPPAPLTAEEQARLDALLKD